MVTRIITINSNLDFSIYTRQETFNNNTFSGLYIENHTCLIYEDEIPSVFQSNHVPDHVYDFGALNPNPVSELFYHVRF